MSPPLLNPRSKNTLRKKYLYNYFVITFVIIFSFKLTLCFDFFYIVLIFVHIPNFVCIYLVVTKVIPQMNVQINISRMNIMKCIVFAAEKCYLYMYFRTTLIISLCSYSFYCFNFCVDLCFFFFVYFWLFCKMSNNYCGINFFNTKLTSKIKKKKN